MVIFNEFSSPQNLKNPKFRLFCPKMAIFGPFWPFFTDFKIGPSQKWKNGKFKESLKNDHFAQKRSIFAQKGPKMTFFDQKKPKF